MSEAAKQRFFRLLAMAQSGHLAEAEEAVTTALRLTPKDPNLLHLAAQIAEGKGDRPRALTFLRRALAAHPDWMEAKYNLARILFAEKQQEEALALMAKLTEQHPQNAMLWEARARFAQTLRQLPEAAENWRKALALRPDNPEGRAQYLICLREMCDWREEPAPDPALPPRACTFLFDDPAVQKESALRYCEKTFGKITPLPAPPPYRHNRLRVGYLSSDFHAHATSWLIAELFSLHHRTSFEIFAYSYGVEDRSDIRARLRREAEHFVELNDLTPRACAERIRVDEIDILIDLKGHTHGARLDILAYRPAPIQIHWLGYPGTTGAPFIDYFIADPITITDSMETFFTEKVLRLPRTYQINDRQKQAAAPLSRAEYGLPEEGFIFGCFNQTYKITRAMFDLWCDILREVPDSALWLYESNAAAPENLRRTAEANGIDPARLVFAKPAPQAQHLARYAHVDLALDTFPPGGHTTTSDALWCGAPVVAMAGRSFVSRVAASLLTAADLLHLVTNTPEQYKARALKLAQDPAALAEVRAHLRGRRGILPLFDTPQFVRDFEELLVKTTTFEGL